MYKDVFPEWLPNSDEDREVYVAFLDFMNRAMEQIRPKEAESK